MSKSDKEEKKKYISAQSIKNCREWKWTWKYSEHKAEKLKLSVYSQLFNHSIFMILSVPLFSYLFVEVEERRWLPQLFAVFWCFPPEEQVTKEDKTLFCNGSNLN